MLCRRRPELGEGQDRRGSSRVNHRDVSRPARSRACLQSLPRGRLGIHRSGLDRGDPSTIPRRSQGCRGARTHSVVFRQLLSGSPACHWLSIQWHQAVPSEVPRCLHGTHIPIRLRWAAGTQPRSSAKSLPRPRRYTQVEYSRSPTLRCRM